MGRALKPCPQDRLKLRQQPCEVRLEYRQNDGGVPILAAVATSWLTLVYFHSLLDLSFVKLEVRAEMAPLSIAGSMPDISNQSPPPPTLKLGRDLRILFNTVPCVFTTN